MPPVYVERHEARLAETRAARNEVEFEKAWEEGRRFDLSAAIALALAYDLSSLPSLEEWSLTQ